MRDSLDVDHLVVAARTLADGEAWCADVFGLRPAAGGQHAFMGTHNRVFDVSSTRHPRAYLEIIAIDPTLPAPGRPRWFELDENSMQARIARVPQLVHWAARVPDAEAARAALWQERGVDCGTVVDAQRGLLRWRITLRDDGRRPEGGRVPALIEWRGAHPTDALTPSGVELLEIGTDPSLRARLQTPRGTVELTCPD